MPDIALRFYKDMLVLSAPVATSLTQQGVNVERDLEYVNLVEPEAVRDALRLEKLAGAQCLVANTVNLTPAYLSHRGMDDRMPEFVAAALDTARELTPQHVLVEVGPCGLPLDASSKQSLNEHRDQYARAARACADQVFDAFLLNGFTNPTDLKCALMGVRQVTDAPVFASVEVAADGTLDKGRATLEEALDVMGEFEASVAGFTTAAPLADVVALTRRAAAATELPLLVQLQVREVNPKQWEATDENPYYCPDVMVDAATQLRAAGVQFLRAVGVATPAYTGALVAATDGFDTLRTGEGE